MLNSKPVGQVAEQEKMPFEVTPFVLYLTRASKTPTETPDAQGKPDRFKLVPTTPDKSSEPIIK